MFKHQTANSFWKTYDRLPLTIQQTANQQFKLLEANPRHPSLHFKKLTSRLWSARVNDDYRTLATPIEGGFLGLWIGSHSEYDRIIKNS